MWSVRSVQVASSAQYIVEQFRATTGCARLGDGAGAVRSMYASSRVRLAMLQDPTGGGGGEAHEGSFVFWQLTPRMWLVEMSVAGSTSPRAAKAASPGAAHRGSAPTRREAAPARSAARYRSACHSSQSTTPAGIVPHRDAILFIYCIVLLFPFVALCINHTIWHACLACTAVVTASNYSPPACLASHA
jgi:hypothetical protein